MQDSSANGPQADFGARLPNPSGPTQPPTPTPPKNYYDSYKREALESQAYFIDGTHQRAKSPS
jgi:hypothetical protein